MAATSFIWVFICGGPLSGDDDDYLMNGTIGHLSPGTQLLWRLRPSGGQLSNTWLTNAPPPVWGTSSQTVPHIHYLLEGKVTSFNLP